MDEALAVEAHVTDAYPLAAGIDKLAEQSTWPTENVARFDGAILLVFSEVSISSHP